MKKVAKRDFTLFLSILLLITTLCMSIGYAAINAITLETVGTVTANVQSGVFITDVSYYSDVNANTANCEINNMYQTLLDSSISLSSSDSNSSITYQVTVYNRTNDTYAFKGISYMQNMYSNEDIKCEVSDIDLNDTIESQSSKTFKITFSYNNGLGASNTLDSKINLGFAPNHTITYTNITDNGYQSNIAEGLSYTNTFTNDVPDSVEVTMGGTPLTENTDFTYNSGTLTIPNVTGDLTINGISRNPFDNTVTADNTSFIFENMTYDELLAQDFSFINDSGKTIKRVNVRITATVRKTGSGSTGNQYIYPKLIYNNTTSSLMSVSISTTSSDSRQVTSNLGYISKNITNGSNFVLDFTESSRSTIITIDSIDKVEVTFTF